MNIKKLQISVINNAVPAIAWVHSSSLCEICQSEKNELELMLK